MSAATMVKLLNQASVVPGEDGCYSTAQLLSGIYGRMHEERLKTQQQLTRKYELANKVTEASLLDRGALMAGFAQVADAMVSIITTSGLTREEKENLQKELASIPIVVDGVAKRQSKLRRNGNGQKAEEEQGES